MLELIDVHTYYGDSHVLHGISLAVEGSSLVALLGRNGAGKTTAIYSIVGFNPPQHGKVYFKGVDITGIQPYKITQMGMALVPQGRRIFRSLTVKENLLIAVRKTNKLDWDLDKVFSLFPRLRERANMRGNHLSGGELQMLALGRALMSNPEFLLMDEPSEGLAPLLVHHLGNTIQQIKSEGRVSGILVEQNFHLAIKVADYAYIMCNGKMVYCSTPKELRDNQKVKGEYLGV